MSDFARIGRAVGAPGFVTACVTAFRKAMRQAGLEPTTFCSGGRRGRRLPTLVDVV